MAEKNLIKKTRNMPIAILPTMVGACTLANVYQGFGFMWIKHITIWAAAIILISYQRDQDHHHQSPDGLGHGTGERQGHLQVAEDP